MISNQTVQEFKDVIKSEYSVVLSDSDAQNILLGLVNFFDLLAQIDSRKEVLSL